MLVWYGPPTVYEHLANHFRAIIRNNPYLIDQLIVHRSVIHDIRVSKSPNARHLEVRSCNLLHSSLYISILVQMAKPPRVGTGKVLHLAIDLEVPAYSLGCLRGRPGEAPGHGFGQACQDDGGAEESREGGLHGGRTNVVEEMLSQFLMRNAWAFVVIWCAGQDRGHCG